MWATGWWGGSFEFRLKSVVFFPSKHLTLVWPWNFTWTKDINESAAQAGNVHGMLFRVIRSWCAVSYRGNKRYTLSCSWAQDVHPERTPGASQLPARNVWLDKQRNVLEGKRAVGLAIRCFNSTDWRWQGQHTVLSYTQSAGCAHAHTQKQILCFIYCNAKLDLISN